ncbi:MAG: cupin domain-containing protein [Actinomycetota bacterium]
MTETTQDPQAAMAALLCQQLADATFAKTGRRSFFEYRDTGLADATGGAYRAQVMRATDVMETTGWHYHVCDLQFVYVLQGWVDLAFADGRTERVAAGAAMAIPPGMVHNELAVSEDFEALEVVAPAEMDTVAVDGPSAVAGTSPGA